MTIPAVQDELINKQKNTKQIPKYFFVYLTVDMNSNAQTS